MALPRQKVVSADAVFDPVGARVSLVGVVVEGEVADPVGAEVEFAVVGELAEPVGVEVGAELVGEHVDVVVHVGAGGVELVLRGFVADEFAEVAGDVRVVEFVGLGLHDGVQESVVEVHAQHLGVEVVEAHVVGAYRADEPVVFLDAVHAGDDHADLQEFRVGAADAGGFGVDPEQHVWFGWRFWRVEGFAADGDVVLGVHSLPFLMSIWAGRSSGGGQGWRVPSALSCCQPTVR